MVLRSLPILIHVFKIFYYHLLQLCLLKAAILIKDVTCFLFQETNKYDEMFKIPYRQLVAEIEACDPLVTH